MNCAIHVLQEEEMLGGGGEGRRWPYRNVETQMLCFNCEGIVLRAKPAALCVGGGGGRRGGIILEQASPGELTTPLPPTPLPCSSGSPALPSTGKVTFQRRRERERKVLTETSLVMKRPRFAPLSSGKVRCQRRLPPRSGSRYQGKH